MKINPVDSPDVTDASCLERTGRTLQQWFAELDAFGGVAKGRRELSNYVLERANKDAWWTTTIVVEYERAKGEKEKDGKPTGYAICSTKTISAPMERVFESFGDAVLLDRWLGASTRIEFREGGTLENADGDRATFKKIRTNKDIKCTWESERLAPSSAVEVLFADKGKGKTGVTLNHTRIQSRRDADQARAAWGDALERLKTLLESA